MTAHPSRARRFLHGGLRRTAGFAVIALVAALLSACNASADAGKTVIKIGDPGNQGLLAYAKKTGILEERLEKADAKLEWGGSYASFTATIDAVRSGSINLLQGAISPAVGYLSTSKDLKIFAVADRTTDPTAPINDGLVVPGDSDIRTVKDLVGKKVAVNQGGRGHYMLFRALDQAGIAHDQVKLVNLPPDKAAGAFAAGQVDAWWAIVRGYPQAVANGARTIVSDRDVDNLDLTILAAKAELAKENPEALKVIQEVLAELNAEALKEPEKFQNVFSDSGPRATSGELLERDTEITRHQEPFRLVEDADIATIQEVADYFLKTKMISAPVDARDSVVQLGS